MAENYEFEYTAENISPFAFFCECQTALLRQENAELTDWIEESDWASPGKIEHFHKQNVSDGYRSVYEISCHKPFECQMSREGAYSFILQFDFAGKNKGSGYCFISGAAS